MILEAVQEPVAQSSAAGKFWRRVGLAIILLALVSIGVTFVILMGLTSIDPTREVIMVAMTINGALAAILVGVIAFEILKLWQARRRGRAAARLHVRVVALFSVVAAVPAVLMAILAAITLDRGLDRWFEDRTRQIIDNALTVAQAYLQEHARVLRGDLIAMTNDIDRAKAVYEFEPTRFDQFFATQVSLRGILAAFILNENGEVVTRVVIDPNAEVPLPPADSFFKAKSGDPILIAPGSSNLVGGVMKLSAYDNFYLYAVRAIDPRVVEYLRLAETGASQYQQMENSRFGVQVAFALVYLGVALVLLLSAIWIGFGFANRLVSPIRTLISAADEVSKGNLVVKVPTEKSGGDLANLGETFNKMTGQLLGQRDALLAANEQIDRRRRFNEAVLSGVSTGVIGVDDEASIMLINRSALELLQLDEVQILNKSLIEVVPELNDCISDVLKNDSDRVPETQIEITRGGRLRTINVRITREQSTRREHGFVVTLDDITDLVSAQRNSAWADVARRIAHEIKNPLTPIQLSAERIRRRYGKRIEEDREVFDQCIDTIVRQVGDIGQMVDEFSSFARMRKPTKTSGDLREAVRDAAFMQSVANPEISVTADVPSSPVTAVFDARLVGQALTNVVKNAAEAVSARIGDDLPKGKVTVHLRGELEDGSGRIVIDVIDNGIGLPEENRSRLLEPYMTTREKGTGLGLAIVRKILEDHGGGIELLDAPKTNPEDTGTLVRLTLAAHAEIEPETDLQNQTVTAHGA
ncbi:MULTISPECIES: sensor histidine kinase NtrY-like [Stappiaceae]|jgi:two-component system nitrogen regulation sensor histidine kinase NtrY|uniref:sensor histidine kinase NtrY-like n=1 Tax=Stappiaceae TaxID=2821832 RepID=UPI0014470AAC|nr:MULTISPECIES: PAS domain-containing sensor histidine kinase [Stappiaceae]MEE2868399.1 PAS domain-containing sensor histidine kinase [Pseudomonadota bacterium]MBN8182914.1 PAS domain-containing sensor histidine kinase [Roseibium aggregatum]MBO6857680.1 PAS domain-containing sensor histidine kinase [Roseibium sp.]NKX66729.1 PAS domain-containing sensor histidine kinase [Labrenzia sp. 5N]UES44707.1 PAS domain-containing protein [Roseibium aggregatum]